MTVYYVWAHFSKGYDAQKVMLQWLFFQGLDGPAGDKGDDGEAGQPVSYPVGHPFNKKLWHLAAIVLFICNHLLVSGISRTNWWIRTNGTSRKESKSLLSVIEYRFYLSDFVCLPVFLCLNNHISFSFPIHLSMLGSSRSCRTWRTTGRERCQGKAQKI